MFWHPKHMFQFARISRLTVSWKADIFCFVLKKIFFYAKKSNKTYFYLFYSTHKNYIFSVMSKFLLKMTGAYGTMLQNEFPLLKAIYNKFFCFVQVKDYFKEIKYSRENYEASLTYSLSLFLVILYLHAIHQYSVTNNTGLV